MTTANEGNLIEGNLIVPKGARFAVVASRFNHFVVDRLVEGAIDALVRHGADAKNVTVVRVPGAFELPLVVRRLAASKKVDAVIALGAVIRGATPHFDYVAGEAAKGIGAGFPMSACIATADAARGLTVGVHGTTFGGNPLAMAIGNAVLDIVLEPGFIERVAEKGLFLRQRLAELQDRHSRVIEEIRGEGLMMGVKLKLPPAEFANAALAEKLLVIPAGDNVVRLLPPLVVSEEEISEGVRRLDAACDAVEKRLLVSAP